MVADAEVDDDGRNERVLSAPVRARSPPDRRERRRDRRPMGLPPVPRHCEPRAAGLGAWSLPRFTVQHGDWVWQHDRALAVACDAASVLAHTDSLPEAVNAALHEACGGLDPEFMHAIADGAAAAF